MKLINKLTLGHLIVSLLVIAVAFAGISTINHINFTFNEVAEQTIPVIKAIEDARTAGLRIVGCTSEFALVCAENRTNGIALEGAEKEHVKSAIKQYDAAISRYEELVNEHFPEERDFLEIIKNSGERLKNISAELIALKEQGASGSIALEKREEFETAQQEFQKAINDAVLHEEKEFTERKQDVEHAIATSVKNILIAGLLTFIIAIALGVNISKSISKPILKLKNAAVELGKGKLDTRVEIKSSDEVGILATCFNQMAERLEQGIEERKKAMDVLKESEEKFRLVFENARDAIFWANPETGLIVRCNKAAENLLEKENWEIIGHHQSTLHPPEKAEYYASVFKRHIQQKGSADEEAEVITKSGKIKPVHITASMTIVRRKPIIQGIFRDITERKRAEEALRESEERYRNLVMNLPDVTWTSDFTGKTTFINHAVEKIYGFTPEEICQGGESLWFGRIHPDDIESVKKAYEELFTANKKFDFEYRIQRKDGGWIWLHDRAITTYEKDGMKYADGIFSDVTERKKLEELRLENERLTYADRAKSEFLERMSHELRTPLNSIIGFSELLKTTGELNEKQKRHVDNIHESGKQLLSIVSGILDLVQAESGREIELVINRFSVIKVIDESLNVIKNKAVQKNVIIKKEVDPLLDFIEADKLRFRQILVNLLDNAVKFSKTEGGVVTVKTKKEGDMAKFSVSDTGIGIKEEDVRKLFQRFEQLESGTTRKYGGAGLGLVISKKLVELHGGKISAESRYGEGSTFTFLLPLKAKREAIG